MDIKAHVGIGDLLCMKAMLDPVQDKIRICADKGIIRDFRNDSPEFKVFLSKFMKMLFTEPHYEIVDDNSAPSISHIELDAVHHLPIRKPDFGHLLPAGKDLDIGPYIAVTTKIRHVPRCEYDTFKLRFVKSLNHLSKKYKIVIMGEKAISNNAENAYYGPNEIYSIYEDIKSIRNSIDLSVSQSTDFSFESLIQDCHIMRKSLRTITIGEGGNLSLAMAFSFILGYRKKNALGHTFLERMFPKAEAYQNAYVTTNLDHFFVYLNNL